MRAPMQAGMRPTHACMARYAQVYELKQDAAPSHKAKQAAAAAAGGQQQQQQHQHQQQQKQHQADAMQTT